VATNRSWTTATGELKEEAQFHRIIAWQKLAELCSKLLIKGKKVYLEGRITYRTFTGKDGVQRTITEIVLDDFVVFDSQRRVDENAQPVPAPSLPIENSVSGQPIIEKSEEEKTEIKKTKKKESSKKEDSNEEKVEPEDIPF
jgi:single-strand DNA-binding protein